MTIAAIDTGRLLRVLYTAFAAGVGASLIFSLAVYGLVRSNDMRREHRPVAALGFGVVGSVAVLATIALVVFGLVLLARKS